MEFSGLGTAIDDFDMQHCLLSAALRIRDPHFEEAFFIEDSSVCKFVLIFRFRATMVLRHECVVWKRSLRIDVHHAIPRMTRQRIFVEPILLHVLAVIAFLIHETEESLFENRILAVPHRDTEAERALFITPATNAIFAPSIRATSRVIVWEKTPRISIGGVVLAHGSPLALGEIRSPMPPLKAFIGVDHAFAFGQH